MTETERVPRPDGRGGRWLRRLLGISLMIALAAASGWAIATVFAPPRDVLAESPYTYVELVDGEVGSSISLNAVAEWAKVPAGTNQSVGTVTSVAVSAGDEVAVGAVLYSVNLRPVVVAEGSTPSFRALNRGAVGADVRQLQQFLAELGLYDGEADGEFGARTEAAVKEWQESLELDSDGVVQAGDLMFLPAVPTRVLVDDEIVHRGAVLTGGETAVSSLAPEPLFTVPATLKQAAAMPVGTPVELQEPSGGVWQATVSAQQMSEDSPEQMNLTLQGIGGSICGDGCGVLPVAGQNLLPSTVVTQAPVHGVIAPSAALASDPNGAVYVTDKAGRRHSVKVVAEAQGMSIIEGAETGLKVRIPAVPDQTSRSNNNAAR